MADDWPKIKARQTTRVSPWMAIIEREVEFARGAEPQLYHAVGQQDYIAIVAALPDGRIPIIRQYRPALESFTWNCRPGSSIRAGCGHLLRPRAHGGDRLCRPRRSYARLLRALHVAAVEPDAFVLR